MKTPRFHLSSLFVLLLMAGAGGGLATAWTPLPERAGPLGIFPESLEVPITFDAELARVDPEKNRAQWTSMALDLADNWRMTGQYEREMELRWRWLRLPASHKFSEDLMVNGGCRMAGSLADLYCLSGQWAVALPLQQLALKADSDSAQILRLAVIQRNVGLIKEARRSIETAIQERRPTAKSPVTPGPRLAECIEEYGKILIADGMPADEVRNYIYKKYNFIDDPGESQP